MKLYLDDTREAPKGWVRCYWPEEVIKYIQTESVEMISLDHDLGDDEHGTGMTVLNWIEEQVYTNDKFVLPIIWVHSANAPKRIEMIKLINRLNEVNAQMEK